MLKEICFWITYKKYFFYFYFEKKSFKKINFKNRSKDIISNNP